MSNNLIKTFDIEAEIEAKRVNAKSAIILELINKVKCDYNNLPLQFVNQVLNKKEYLNKTMKLSVIESDIRLQFDNQNKFWNAELQAEELRLQKIKYSIERYSDEIKRVAELSIKRSV